jgi:hypothetical protein
MHSLADGLSIFGSLVRSSTRNKALKDHIDIRRALNPKRRESPFLPSPSPNSFARFPRTPAHRPLQRRNQSRSLQAKFFSMFERKPAQHFFSLARQRNPDFTPVLRRAVPPHIPACLESVCQLNRAVMLNLQLLRQLPDPRPHIRWQPFQCQHQLMLVRLNSGRARRPLTEMNKTAYLVPQFRQRSVVCQSDRPFHAGKYIVSKNYIVMRYN